MTQGPAPADLRLQRTSRDVPQRLATWMSGHLPGGAVPEIVLRSGIDRRRSSARSSR